LIRSFFGKAPAKLANHRSPVLPLSLRPSTRHCEGRFRKISGGAAAAEEFGDGSMTAVLGKAARGLSIIRLDVQIRAMLQQHFHDFEVPVGRRRRQQRIPRGP